MGISHLLRDRRHVWFLPAAPVLLPRAASLRSLARSTGWTELGTREKPRKLNREPDMDHWRRAERQSQHRSRSAALVGQEVQRAGFR